MKKVKATKQMVLIGFTDESANALVEKGMSIKTIDVLSYDLEIGTIEFLANKGFSSIDKVKKITVELLQKFNFVGDGEGQLTLLQAVEFSDFLKKQIEADKTLQVAAAQTFVQEIKVVKDRKLKDYSLVELLEKFVAEPENEKVRKVLLNNQAIVTAITKSVSKKWIVVNQDNTINIQETLDYCKYLNQPGSEAQKITFNGLALKRFSEIIEEEKIYVDPFDSSKSLNGRVDGKGQDWSKVLDELVLAIIFLSLTDTERFSRLDPEDAYEVLANKTEDQLSNRWKNILNDYRVAKEDVNSQASKVTLFYQGNSATRRHNFSNLGDNNSMQIKGSRNFVMPGVSNSNVNISIGSKSLANCVRDYVANNEIEQALQHLRLNAGSNLQDSIILLISRYNSNEKDNNLGVLDPDDYRTNQARIVQSILSLL